MINSLDLSKFIAAILVVLIHVFAVRNYEPPAVLTFMLHMVVPFFFTISGYLLLYKKENRQLHSTQIDKYLRKYLKLYLIWLLIYSPLEISVLCDMNLPITKIICNLGWNFMVTGRFYKAWPLWYLLAALHSIAIIGLLLRCGIKLCGLLFIAFFLMLAGWFLNDSSLPVLDSVREFYFTYFYTTRNGVFQALGYMAGGMLVAAYMAVFKQLPQLGVIILCIVCGIGAFYRWPLCNVLFSSILLLLIVSLRIGDHPIWSKLRKLLLLYYLLHIGVIYAVICFLPHISSLLFFTIIVFAFTTIIALLLLYLQKKRGFSWLKQLW